MVALEPLGERLLGVVGALREARLDLLSIVALRRAELHVVDLARIRVQPPARDALDENVVGHLQQDGLGRHQEELLHLLGLRLGPREAVEKPTALLALGLVELIGDEADDEVVGHELTRLHVLLGLLAELVRLVLGGLAQHVARRDVDELEHLNNLLALRPFARGRRARDDNVHNRLDGAIVALHQTVLRRLGHTDGRTVPD
mmetsp:Transcript_86377/g.259125  ORF Transcript_86377/g.259125 Transcript_86377/m.259125 type:complete len:202 (-) Transcript_86377:1102-1707(-)